MAEVQVDKKLKILMAAAKRIHKEYFTYQMESLQLQQKLMLLQMQQAEELSIKKHKELIDENTSMFPNVRQRLEGTVLSIEQYVNNNQVESEQLKEEAQLLIQEMQTFIDNINANGA